MTANNRLFNLAALCAALMMLAGCSETQFVSHWAKKITWPGQTESAGTYKIGKPYRVGSVWYYPQEDFNLVETGIASWYGPDFHGGRTANGERYDMEELTGAHRTLQMPSLVRVTNLENGRSVVVRINDRGPYKHGRIIDVSRRAAELLDFIGKGTARVKLEVLTRESRQMAEAAKRGMDTSRLTMADLQRYDPDKMAANGVQPMQAQPVSLTTNSSGPLPPPAQQATKIASRDYGSDALPESLQTPTITVEELSAPPSNLRGYQPSKPVMQSSPPPQQQPQPQTNSGMLGRDEQYATPSGMAAGRMDQQGHFMPAPVVRQEPVARTGIFVQAGAFSVRANADKLERNLDGIAPVRIDPVTVRGQTMYRVKLGPIASVEKADAVLERVIALGNNTARVVHDK